MTWENFQNLWNTLGVIVMVGAGVLWVVQRFIPLRIVWWWTWRVVLGRLEWLQDCSS